MAILLQNGDQLLIQSGDVLLEQAAGTNNLTANDVESASELTDPAIGQEHSLTATDVASASEVTSPAVGQEHSLAANDVESASELSSPAVGQEHSLAASDVESASEVSTPVLTEVTMARGTAKPLRSVSLDNRGFVKLTPNVIIPTDVLTANEVESASEVSTPSLGQVHSLVSTAVESASELTVPTLIDNGVGGTDNLLANDVTSLSEVTTPALSEGNYASNLLITFFLDATGHAAGAQKEARRLKKPIDDDEIIQIVIALDKKLRGF